MAWCLCYSHNRVIGDKEFHKEFPFCKTTSIIGELVPAPETSPCGMKMLGVCHAKIYICCELYMNNRLSRLYWNKHHMNTYHMYICYVFSLDIQKCLYRELHLKNRYIYASTHKRLTQIPKCFNVVVWCSVHITIARDFHPYNKKTRHASKWCWKSLILSRHRGAGIPSTTCPRLRQLQSPKSQHKQGKTCGTEIKDVPLKWVEHFPAVHPWFFIEIIPSKGNPTQIWVARNCWYTVDNSGIGWVEGCNVKSGAKLLFWWQVIGSLLLVPCRVKNCISI